ncbi:transmembrane protein 108-like [Sinocyclocheilus rhinocerous]|uniref:transmembrane protein 108-like n=1 Tax=Sinocyclocheilus rhinocerous TaxID=307959 RepID=UPI0007B92512|nr:PREDICTED: transmembrane protein 108-like [Sinocyclocheilus rhinocerous]
MLENVGTEEELDFEDFEDSGLDPTDGLLDPSSGPSPATTSSAVIPTPTSLQTTARPSGPASDITTVALEQQLVANEQTTAPSGPTAVPTSLASAPHYISIVSASLATTPTTGPSGPPAMTPAAPQQQLAVDERNIPGMDRVDSLAQYLVGLRNETGQTLNSQQASTVIALWQNLLPYDQQRVTYSARHQSRLTTGRFRCSKKKPEFTEHDTLCPRIDRIPCPVSRLLSSGRVHFCKTL